MTPCHSQLLLYLISPLHRILKRVFFLLISVCTRSIDASNMTGNATKYPDVSTYDGSILIPWQGNLRINDESPSSSWCANSSDPGKIQFLQLDFKLVKVMQTIAIQSHSSEDKWVTAFTISSSLDGLFWKQYTEDGILKVKSDN